MNSVPCVGLLAACLLHVLAVINQSRALRTFKNVAKEVNISNDLCFAV